MPAINNTPNASTIVADILRTNALEQTGLISKSTPARMSVTSLVT